MRSFVRSLLVTCSAVALLSVAGFAFASNAENGNAALVHVGLNVPECTGPFAGNNSGVVNAHYNAVRGRLMINVAVHDALPNTTYVVDIRCIGAVGSLTTNSQGTGTTQINLPMKTDPGSFYVDIAVPPVESGPALGGAGGYGDTFIAGPFSL